MTITAQMIVVTTMDIVPIIMILITMVQDIHNVIIIMRIILMILHKQLILV